jgi:acyl-CoA synthetase (AMP-forming)/AMP-acid ligase II
MAGFTAFVLASVPGCPHIILPGFRPADVLDAIERHRVTGTCLVPTMVALLLDDPGFADRDLSSLRRIVYGASTMPQATLERALSALPGVGFVQSYGMTELSPIATLLAPQDHTPDRLRSAGRAAPHTELRVVDPADDNDLPTGQVGEILVRGANVMTGYWNRPEETESALRGGWMHTGDAGYLDPDGYLYVVDRFKDMIITGAENVYSAEVENALMHHPAIASCAVVGLPDPRWGERIHAVVVLAAGAAADEQELRDHVRRLIAGYKVPRSVEFRDALPMSGAGKILKNQLRGAYLSN